MLNVVNCKKLVRRLFDYCGRSCCAAIVGLVVVQAAGLAQAPEPSYRVRGSVSGRLELPRATQSVKLAEETDIPLRAHDFKVHSVIARFSYFDSAGNPLFTDPETELPIQFYPDGSAYVGIVPEKVGKAQLHLEVRFEDGGVQSTSIEVEVGLPDKSPEKFMVNREGVGDRTTGTIYMDLSAMSNQSDLFPIAVYSGHEGPVPIPDENIQFKIVSANAADPPIRINPSTGRITALHIGHALVQSTFEDFSDLTCVDVMEDASYGGDRTNCAELVPPGMTAPPSKTVIDGKKPPSKIRVAPEP